MKKISKKLLSFLLAFGMILSMFTVNSATIWAADEHVPASATLVAYPEKYSRNRGMSRVYDAASIW